MTRRSTGNRPDLETAVRAALEPDPAIDGVELVGSLPALGYEA